MSILCLTNSQYEDLTLHLLGKSSEQLAFLFASISHSGHDLQLQCDTMLAIPKWGFDYQSAYHISLADAMKQKVLIQASDTNTCLVEAHSHLDEMGLAKFSASDLAGFKEFVPHVRWRLNNRPYIALVFNTRGFDALLWIGRDNLVKPLSSIRVANRDIKPTCFTYNEIQRSRRKKGFEIEI